MSQQLSLLEISEVSASDHQEVVRVKNMIRKLVDDELEYLGYLDQLSEEESSALVEKTMNEVSARSSYYFKIDPARPDTNKTQFDKKAPGNKHRHINSIVPHDNIDVQDYFDVENLTPEVQDQILTYFTFLVDLHIGQIRP